MRGIQWIFSKLFGLVSGVRVSLYRYGILRSRRLPWPVISVGNLTVGGTGKTPLVASLATLLRGWGYQPVILSRGYRGSAETSNLLVSDGRGPLCSQEQCGDEPFYLAQHLRGTMVVVGKNRRKSARLVKISSGRCIFLLDDGFQHLKIRPDINLLLIDATDPFSSKRLLPYGRLREPLSATSRADAVIITRCHLVDSTKGIEKELQHHAPAIQLFHGYHQIECACELSSRVQMGVAEIATNPILALASIGNPEQFLLDLQRSGFEISERVFFRDHHSYSEMDLAEIQERCKQSGASAVITTEKDAVRLASFRLPKNLYFSLRIRSRLREESEFEGWLSGTMGLTTGTESA